MSTTTPTHRRSILRRVLGVAMTLLLAGISLGLVILAGGFVTTSDLLQPIPADARSTPSIGHRYSEPADSAIPAAARHGRRLVVAFVAGTDGTIASDLLAPYDIFASSPAFRLTSSRRRRPRARSKVDPHSRRRTHSPTSTRTRP